MRSVIWMCILCSLSSAAAPFACEPSDSIQRQLLQINKLAVEDRRDAAKTMLNAALKRYPTTCSSISDISNSCGAARRQTVVR